jgi:hypothetical protein
MVPPAFSFPFIEDFVMDRQTERVEVPWWLYGQTSKNLRFRIGPGGDSRPLAVLRKARSGFTRVERHVVRTAERASIPWDVTPNKLVRFRVRIGEWVQPIHFASSSFSAVTVPDFNAEPFGLDAILESYNATAVIGRWQLWQWEQTRKCQFVLVHTIDAGGLTGPDLRAILNLFNVELVKFFTAVDKVVAK